MRQMITFPNYLTGVVIGCLLGDAMLRKAKSAYAPRFIMGQSLVNFPFL